MTEDVFGLSVVRSQRVLPVTMQRRRSNAVNHSSRQIPLLDVPQRNFHLKCASLCRQRLKSWWISVHGNTKDNPCPELSVTTDLRDRQYVNRLLSLTSQILGLKTQYEFDLQQEARMVPDESGDRLVLYSGK